MENEEIPLHASRQVDWTATNVEITATNVEISSATDRSLVDQNVENKQEWSPIENEQEWSPYYMEWTSSRSHPSWNTNLHHPGRESMMYRSASSRSNNDGSILSICTTECYAEDLGGRFLAFHANEKYPVVVPPEIFPPPSPVKDEQQGPQCRCRVAACMSYVARESSESATKARKYWHCEKRVCGYFAWVKEGDTQADAFVIDIDTPRTNIDDDGKEVSIEVKEKSDSAHRGDLKTPCMISDTKNAKEKGSSAKATNSCCCVQ